MAIVAESLYLKTSTSIVGQVGYVLLFSILLSCNRVIPSPNTVKTGGINPIPTTLDPPSIDPISGDAFAWQVRGQVFKRLVTYTLEESEIVPLSAENFIEWDSSLTMEMIISPLGPLQFMMMLILRQLRVESDLKFFDDATLQMLSKHNDSLSVVSNWEKGLVSLLNYRFELWQKY